MDNLFNKRFSVNRVQWKDTQKHYLDWRKTDDYKKWNHDQFLRQGGTCYYCDTPLAGVRQNVEHIVPKSRGGTNKKSNLVLACSSCNRAKNTSVLTNQQRKELRQKNSHKKGTYHLLKDKYQTEQDIGFMLREMFKYD